MPKESFTYPQTEKLLKLLDETARRSAVSRSQAFEDFLEVTICALSGGRMEEQYLATIEKHTSGKPGKRGCDSLATMFGEVVHQMESEPGEPMEDPLGDLFQGAVTFGENGQFMTPMNVCRMMAKSIMADFEPPADRRPTVNDPCCGSGRMLLAAAEIHRNAVFYGTDVDLRCVKMTVINLALQGLRGYVVHGNTLSLETHKAYRTGFDLTGFVREIPLEDCPLPAPSGASATRPTKNAGLLPEDDDHRQPPTQLGLF